MQSCPKDKGQKEKVGQAWSEVCLVLAEMVPVIPVLERWKLEDQKLKVTWLCSGFKSILGYTRPYLHPPKMSADITVLSFLLASLKGGAQKVSMFSGVFHLLSGQ